MSLYSENKNVNLESEELAKLIHERMCRTRGSVSGLLADNRPGIRGRFTTDRASAAGSQPTGHPRPIHDRPGIRAGFTTDGAFTPGLQPTGHPRPVHNRPGIRAWFNRKAEKQNKICLFSQVANICDAKRFWWIMSKLKINWQIKMYKDLHRIILFSCDKSWNMNNLHFCKKIKILWTFTNRLCSLRTVNYYWRYHHGVNVTATSRRHWVYTPSNIGAYSGATVIVRTALKLTSTGVSLDYTRDTANFSGLWIIECSDRKSGIFFLIFDQKKDCYSLEPQWLAPRI